MAAQKEKSELVELLLEHKASVDVQDKVMRAWACAGARTCVVTLCWSFGLGLIMLELMCVLWVTCRIMIGIREPILSRRVL